MAETSPLSIEQRPNAVVVHVHVKDLDEEHLGEVRAEMKNSVDKSDGLPFVIDLQEVKFVPSITLGALVKLSTEFKSRGQRLVLVSLQPMIRQVFSITRLDRIFEILPSVDSALQNIGGAAQ